MSADAIKQLEYAAVLADNFGQCAMKCKRCGDVRLDRYAGGCTGEAEYRASDEYQRRVVFEGEWETMRYFEKHLCRPVEMSIEEAFAECAAILRARAEALKATPGDDT